MRGEIEHLFIHNSGKIWLSQHLSFFGVSCLKEHLRLNVLSPAEESELALSGQEMEKYMIHST
jgi:hypothetical protein